MASLQAHILDFAVRRQIKAKLTGNTDLLRARKALEGGSLPVPKTAMFEPGTVGGIPGEWVRTASQHATATLLYLHGGGYFACSPRTHRPIAAAFAKHGFQVFVPDYRLAPEHPFPAAIEDAEAAWNGLLAMGHLASALTVAGDSAGGGLSLALLLTLRDKGVQLPAAAALLSPWTDLAGTGASIVSNAQRDAMFWAPGLLSAGAFYLGDKPANTPLASPLYADLQDLPPLIIHAGDRELLRDDSTRLAEKARASKVSVELKIWPVVPHVWQLAQFVPEARQSIAQMAEFLRRHAAIAHDAP